MDDSNAPVTTIGLCAPVAVTPSGLLVTVYPLSVRPPARHTLSELNERRHKPELVGAVNETEACALPGVACTLVGGCEIDAATHEPVLL